MGIGLISCNFLWHNHSWPQKNRYLPVLCVRAICCTSLWRGLNLIELWNFLKCWKLFFHLKYWPDRCHYWSSVHWEHITVGRLPGGRPTTFRVHVESCWPFKRPPTPHNRSHLLGWRIYPGPGWKQLQVQMMTFSGCFHSSTVNTPSRNWNRVYKNISLRLSF